MPVCWYARYTFVEEGSRNVLHWLYKAYDGHALTRLRISRCSSVLKEITTDILEDEDEELYVLRSSDSFDDSG